MEVLKNMNAKQRKLRQSPKTFVQKSYYFMTGQLLISATPAHAHQVEMRVSHIVNVEDACMRAMWTISACQQKMATMCKELHSMNEAIAASFCSLKNATGPYRERDY